MLELLKKLQQQGIKLKTDGDELVISAPAAGIAPDLLLALKQHKSGIIDFLNTTLAPKKPGITAAPPQDSYPLSPTQHRYWLDYLDGHDGLFGNMFHQAVFAEGFDTACYSQAINLFRSHYTLVRTRFVKTGAGIRQEILPFAPIQIPVTDLSNHAAAADALQEIIAQEKKTPFLLNGTGLFRTQLIRNGNHYTALISSHHLIVDGIGFQLMLEEVARYYQNIKTGLVHTLKPPVLQYYDFCDWTMHAYQQPASMQQHRRFWHQQLAHIQNTKYLPIDYNQQALPDFSGRYFEFFLTPQQQTRLEQKVAQYRITPFCLLLAVQYLTFIPLTGNTDLIIGTAVSGRNKPELERMIGYFANLIVMRCPHHAGQPIPDFIQQVAATYATASEHQYYQINDIITDLDIPRRPWALPLTTHYIIYMESPLEISDLSMQGFNNMDWNQRSDFTINITRYTNAWGVQFRYRKCLFSDALIHQIADGYVHTLNQVLAAL